MLFSTEKDFDIDTGTMHDILVFFDINTSCVSKCLFIKQYKISNYANNWGKVCITCMLFITLR